MDFFGIGTWELLVIGLLALIVLGPRQMILIARKAGELMRQFQTMWQEASQTITQEFQTIESEGDDLKGLSSELRDIGREIQQGMKITLPAIGSDTNRIGQPPASPPKPPSAWASSPASSNPAASNGTATEAQTPEESTKPAAESTPQPADSAPSTTQPANPTPPASKYSAWINKPPAK